MSVNVDIIRHLTIGRRKPAVEYEYSGGSMGYRRGFLLTRGRSDKELIAAIEEQVAADNGISPLELSERLRHLPLKPRRAAQPSCLMGLFGLLIMGACILLGMYLIIGFAVWLGVDVWISENMVWIILTALALIALGAAIRHPFLFWFFILLLLL